MEKYLDDYNRNKHKASQSQLAFNYIITDLLQKNLTGDDKIRTLTGNNMENSSPSQFVPSMIYAMLYISPKEESKLNNKAFYDRVPIFLCLSCDFNFVTGLNFNFMPNDVRAKVLDLISGDNVVSDNIDAGTDQFRINEKLGKSLMAGNVTTIINILREQTGVDVSMCVRKYARRNVIKSRLIEYDMWEYIPYLNFKDAVRGINLAVVQTEITKTSNK